MPFRNPVVGGGGGLIRDWIQSSNFVTGVSGWRITREGNAEFNEITVRGEVIAQQGDNIVVLGIDDLLSAPGLFFFDEGLEFPASITGAADTDEVVLVLTTSNLNDPLFANPGTSLIIGEQLGSFTRDPLGDEHGLKMFWGDTEYPGGASGLQLVNLPDGIMHTAAETHYPFYVAGAVHTGSTIDTTATNGGPIEDITGAEITNVPVVSDRAYRVMAWVRVASSALNTRGRFRIFDGATQLGQDRLYRITGATTTFVDVPCEFVWRAASTETISSIQFTAQVFSGTGDVTVRVEQSNFLMTIEEIGDADRITNL